MTNFGPSLVVICLLVLTMAGCGNQDQPTALSHEKPQFTELPLAAQPSQPLQDKVSSQTSGSQTTLTTTTSDVQEALPDSVKFEGHLGDSLQVQGMNDDSGSTFWLISGRVSGLSASPAISQQLNLTKAGKITLQGQGKCTFSQETFLLSGTGSEVLIQIMTNGGAETTPACALFVSNLQFKGLKANFSDVPLVGYSGTDSSVPAVSLELLP